VFEAIATGEGDPNTPASFLDLGSSVLPPLPLDGGDRNRTSPFAFTGNKFEFRALGSSMSLAFPNTVLNTIAAEAIDDLAGKLKAKLDAGQAMPEAVMEIVKDSYLANKVVCFDGDGYSEEWHQEAERRGLKNLKTTPDALPEVIADSTVRAFEEYNVLSKRELESRYDVWVEQYAARANIEAEETFSIGQTMILPAGLRQLALIAEAGVSALEGEIRELVDDLVGTLGELKEANAVPDDLEGLDLAKYARDSQLAAMAKVREVGDQLERVVADDLWPLPKYEEMLFIK
jgi:glutamine synthetase